MRPRVAVLALTLLTMPAWSAPTCLDRHGITSRCNVAGAMPVGWQPSPEVLAERARILPPGPDTNAMLNLALGLAALFALIALVPEFDGRDDEDWKRNHEEKPGD